MKYKKILVLLLMVLITIVSIPMQSAAAVKEKTSGRIGENLIWKYKNHTLTISGQGDMEFGDAFDGFPWEAFKDEIQRVVIKEGVRSICNDAFAKYKNLKTFSVAKSLRDVNPDALEGTAWYKAQPKGPVYLAHILYGFKGNMPENYTLKVKNGTTAISRCAVSFKDGLIGVSIPDSVTYIGDSAFSYCENLSSVRMSKKVTYVGEDLFGNTPWQSKQPKGMMYFGKVAYQYNGGVPKNTTIRIKKGTVTIAPLAFDFEEGLTGIVLPDTVVTIGRLAFYGSGLKKLHIPKSVKEIEWNEIDSSALTSITVDSQNKVYASDARGALFNKKMTILYEYPWKNKETSYVLPKTTAQLSAYSLGCVYLKDISIPTAVRIIDATAFTSCTRLLAFHVASGNKYFSSDKTGCLFNKDGTTLLHYPKGKTRTNPCVTVPKKTIAVGDYAFANDERIKEIYMSDSVRSIGECAFVNCCKLSKIDFSKNITSVGPSAITETRWYENQPDGVIYIGKVAYTMKGWKYPVKKLVVKSGTTTIAEGAFIYQTSLQKVELPKSVKQIQEGAFNDCPKLKKVTIMNPKCKINMSEETFPPQAVLYAAEGSTAQAYAEKFDRSFVAV